ncbi:hypothetical protein BN946_scf184857.g41 [Trametes cinnabarina]|uniref:C-CAP/cofactor C-like domain-containing protein n=1 Tax=Pycnoporus cinnabarinus TaxID=5643 RepID=A0A060SYV6_PYCCI|nr:hypothetical protein BN946_scf184857.g41 [Trametes cinnabarina]
MAETNHELTQRFYTRFQAVTSDLLAQLEFLRTGSSTSEFVERLAAEQAKLRKELTDAIAFLPGYDQRQCENKLKDIEAQLESLRAATAPKAKFSFKRKAKPATQASTSAPPSNTETTTSPSIVLPKISPVTTLSETKTHTSGLNLSGHDYSYLTISSLSAPWSAASDLTISDLNDCIVNLVPSDANPDVPHDLTFTALHARNITNSVLILPIVSGSALLHDMNNCVIALGSRQFRMHTSTLVDVYISIASNPIIEHCSAIRFANYPSCLRPVSFTDAAQTPTSNYLAVQDFSHIRATPSPNWSALPEDKLISKIEWPLTQRDVAEALPKLLPASSQ